MKISYEKGEHTAIEAQMTKDMTENNRNHMISNKFRINLTSRWIKGEGIAYKMLW